MSLKLKPREERRTLTDVQPLIEAHYHACKAGEYNRAYGFIFDNHLNNDLALWGHSRVLVELYARLLPDDWKSGGTRLSKLVNHGVIIGNLGEGYRSLGEVNKAIEYLKQALRITRKIRDKHG